MWEYFDSNAVNLFLRHRRWLGKGWSFAIQWHIICISMRILLIIADNTNRCNNRKSQKQNQILSSCFSFCSHIRFHFRDVIRASVRRGLQPGNSIALRVCLTATRFSHQFRCRLFFVASTSSPFRPYVENKNRSRRHCERVSSARPTTHESHSIRPPGTHTHTHTLRT